MTASRTIFDRQWLTPAQLRTVAERRFADAEYLRKSNHNERANGAMYLAGFVVECLLKARLIEAYPWLRHTRAADRLSRDDQRVWSLCYRSHNLDEILSRLPGLTHLLARSDNNVLSSMIAVCEAWTIYARYSSRSATMSEAVEFLARVKEIKRCLLK